MELGHPGAFGGIWVSAGIGKKGLKLLERTENVEASLWRRFRIEGDVECRQRLFLLHQPRARSLALRQFSRRPCYGLTRSDFEQLAYEGLLKALDRFDPLEGTPFPGYFKLHVLGMITDGLNCSSEGAAQFSTRRRMEKERLRSIRPSPKPKPDNPLGELTDIVIDLAIGLMLEETAIVADEDKPDPARDAYGNLAWKQLRQAVRAELSRLPAKELVVIEQHYIYGVRFSQIANLMGVSPARISQLHRSGLEAMRGRLDVFI